jgi:hypothetical protein
MSLSFDCADNLIKAGCVSPLANDVREVVGEGILVPLPCELV